MTRSILTNPDDINNWFKDKGQTFAFDTETNSLSFYKLKCVGFSFSNGIHTCYIYNMDQSTIDCLKTIFKNQIKTLIAHNIVFDLKVLYKYQIPYNHCKLYCTMVADHLLNENRPHGLKYLANKLLDKEVVSFEDASKAGLNTREFIEYAMNDALWTWELCIWQQELLKEQELVHLFRNIEMPFQHVLVEMETNGILLDVPQVVNTTTLLREEITSLLVQLHNIINEPFLLQTNLIDGALTVHSKINFNSTQQLVEIFRKLHLPITEKTSNGAPSVGRKTLEILKGKHEFIDTLRKYKVAVKLLHAFFEPMPEFVDGDGRVRSSFLDTGTKTGRLSCQSPNLQQLPKVNKEFPVDTRRCFIASPGYTMISCDYSGQELRVLTEITKEPVLVDTFIKGKDMHLSTANDFFDLGIAEEDLYETGTNYNNIKHTYAAERNKAKIINFGMAYGKGAYGFSRDFGISEDEAQGILDKYFASLPNVKTAIDQSHDNVRRQGYVSNLLGRRRRFVPVTDGQYSNSSFRQAFNFQIQGLSADMIRLAMNKVRADVQSYHPEWGLRALATVHDEAVYEVKSEYAQEAGAAIKKAFETAVTFCIPIVADVSIGLNYSECK